MSSVYINIIVEVSYEQIPSNQSPHFPVFLFFGLLFSFSSSRSTPSFRSPLLKRQNGFLLVQGHEESVMVVQWFRARVISDPSLISCCPAFFLSFLLDFFSAFTVLMNFSAHSSDEYSFSDPDKILRYSLSHREKLKFSRM